MNSIHEQIKKEREAAMGDGWGINPNLMLDQSQQGLKTQVGDTTIGVEHFRPNVETLNAALQSGNQVAFSQAAKAFTDMWNSAQGNQGRVDL